MRLPLSVPAADHPSGLLQTRLLFYRPSRPERSISTTARAKAVESESDTSFEPDEEAGGFRLAPPSALRAVPAHRTGAAVR